MDELREMLDHFAVEKILKRYARALDEKDYDALDACFTPDAVLDYRAAGGIRDSYPVVKAWLKEVLDPLPEMQHFTTNIVKRPVDFFFRGEQIRAEDTPLKLHMSREEVIHARAPQGVRRLFQRAVDPNAPAAAAASPSPAPASSLPGGGLPGLIRSNPSPPPAAAPAAAAAACEAAVAA